MTKQALKLKKHGLRVTDARLQILDIFQTRAYALSQPDLMELLPATTDRVTVYRILERFVQHGLLHEVADFSGAIHYALCKEQCDEAKHRHDHLHLHCRVCKTTQCTNILLPEFSLPTSFKIEKTSLLMEGVCGDCSQAGLQ